MHRILIVEDEGNFAWGLQVNLREVGYAASIAPTADAAEEAISARPPDLALVDLELPDRWGIDLIRDLRAAGHRFQIMVLTAHGEGTNRIDAFAAGANDFVVKTGDTGPLLARIKARLRDARHGGQAGAGIRLDSSMRTVTAPGGSVALQPKEFEVLEALIAAGGRPCSQAELKSAVWHRKAWFTNAVPYHVSHLRRKLRSIGLEGAIGTVRGRGYFWRPSAAESRPLGDD